MAFTHALATNNYGPAKFIVTSSAANGTHTTIASALADASSGDTIFIRPGTYTENLTLVAGVNLTAYGSDSSLDGTGKVIISGNATFSGTGSVTISGIQLQTNSASFLTVSGSNVSIVNLNNCYLNCLNNTGITYSSSNSSSRVNIYYCTGNLGTTGIAFHTMSSTGLIQYFFCYLTNTGGSTTVTNNSAGISLFESCSISFPIGCTSTGGIGVLLSNIDTSIQNATSLTVNGNGTNTTRHSAFSSGSASAVTVGTGAVLAYVQCNAGSSNTNAITGLGQITVFVPTFSGTSFLINTTDQSSGGILQGSISGNAPNSGFIGQQIRATANPSLTSTVIATVASVSLTAGVWDVSGIVNFVVTTGTVATAGISVNTSFTSQGDDYGNVVAAYTQTTISIPSFRITLSATTTYNLLAQATFVSGGSCFGRISATRVG